MRAWIMFLLTAATAAAGPLSFGLKAGLPLSDAVSAVSSQSFSFTSQPKKYLWGGSAELKLPAGFGVEFDALYRRVDYSGASPSPAATQSVTASAWEFPLLLKYKFPGVVARPFLDAGLAFDTLNGLTQTIAAKTGLSSAPPSGQTSKGFVAGGGFDLNLHVLHLTPEIRYTHWGSSALVDPLDLVRGTQNQADFLLGIVF
jgi:hypothetical protein